LQELPLNIVAAFACAAASYHLIERPMIRFGQRANAALIPGQKDRRDHRLGREPVTDTAQYDP
jgi:peptidoglycan/LPS O-acetylase OafA/YrhL